MKIYLNNREYEVDETVCLSTFLCNCEMPQVGIAVAINNKVIPKTEWENTLLEDETKVTVIKAVCGG